MGVVALVVGVQRRRRAHDLLVAAVPSGVVDADRDGLVGLVGDDAARADLAGCPGARSAGGVPVGAACAWPSPARGGANARRPCARRCSARSSGVAPRRGAAARARGRAPPAAWAGRRARAPEPRARARRGCLGRGRSPRPSAWGSASARSAGVFLSDGFLSLSASCSESMPRWRATVSARARSRLAVPRRRCSPARPWRAGSAARRASRRVVLMCSTSSSSSRSRSSLACISSSSRTTNFDLTGSFVPARRMASRASGSGTPASSNMTRPGLTTATQPSGEPLPEPIRVSAGFFVKLLSG